MPAMSEKEAALANLKRALTEGSEGNAAGLVRQHIFSRDPEIKAAAEELARTRGVSLEGATRTDVQEFTPAQTGNLTFDFNQKMDQIAKAWGDELEKQNASRDVRAKA